MIEERLLTVRGVISFTFNMHRHRCVVRVRSDIKPEVCPAGHLPFLISVRIRTYVLYSVSALEQNHE